MKKLFFTALINAWRQLTDLFDVTWPASQAYRIFVGRLMDSFKRVQLQIKQILQMGFCMGAE